MDAPLSPALEGVQDDAPPECTGGRSPFLTPGEREFADARQDFIDALPVAAAIVCLDGDNEAFVDLSNERFRALAGTDGLASAGSFIAASGIAPKILTFIRGGTNVSQFDATDGLPAGGRIFAV